MLDRSTAWKYLSQRPGQTMVVARLYYGDGTAYLPVASGPLIMEGIDYLPVVKSIPKYHQQVDQWTKRHSIADIKLELLNLELQQGSRISDVLESKGTGADLGFETRQADIRLWKKGITEWADCFQLCPNGVIKDVPHNRDRAIVKIEDKTSITLNKVQFDRVTDADAADTDQGLPVDSRGKIKPYVGGDREQNQFDLTKSTISVSTEHNKTPCIYLGQDSAGNHYWLVSDHIIYDLNVASEPTSFFGWSDELDRYLSMANLLTIVQNTDAGCIVKHENDPTFADIWYGKGTVTPATLGAGASVSDEERVIDKQFDSYCQLEVAAADGVGDFAKVTVPFPDFDDVEIDDIDILIINKRLFGKLIYGGGAGDGDFEVTVDGFAMTEQYPTGADYPEDVLQQIAAGSQAGVAASVEIKIEKQIAANTEIAAFRIYEAYKRVTIKFGRLLPLFFAGQGAELGTWIDGRSTTEGYTETHVDDDNSGALAENPASSMESILRHVGLVDADLDLDSLNVYSNDVAGLKAAAATIEQPRNFPDRIARYAQQFRGFTWWLPSGDLKVKALEDDYTDANLTIPAYMFRNLDFPRSDGKRLYTAVKVRYNYGHAEGRYLSETAIAEDATAQSKYNVTQAQSLLVFDAPDIHEAATAESIRDYLLANWMNIHNLCVGELPEAYVHQDIGDRFEISDMDYLVRGKDITAVFAIAGQNIRPYWFIYDVERSDRLLLKAFQIHELD